MRTLVIIILLSSSYAQELCNQFGYYTDCGYEFNNNAWGLYSGHGSQCTYIDGSDYSGVAWHSTWSWSDGQSNVKAYPYSGRQLPIKQIVNQIYSLPSTALWSYAGTDIRANVAYDLFTSSNMDHPTSSGDYELMIWLGRIGAIWPIGQSVGSVTVEDMQWDLWVGYNGDMKVFTFVAPEERHHYSGDILRYFDYISNTQGFPAESQYLLTFQFGSECFTGDGALFTCHNFWAEAH
ncbi:endoglucanase [Stachybotrys elegans]|uniref:Endoglucanase n=1 Tax=Stachybotrys elegans TaxID=80388 RepID=A0A8K0SB47_9HYPO|nr:endoglucanase [Stachybotrys elegans]